MCLEVHKGLKSENIIDNLGMLKVNDIVTLFIKEENSPISETAYGTLEFFKNFLDNETANFFGRHYVKKSKGFDEHYIPLILNKRKDRLNEGEPQAKYFGMIRFRVNKS